MSITEEERRLLAKLASGVLDGMVGDEREYRNYTSVFCGSILRMENQYLTDKVNQLGSLSEKRMSGSWESARKSISIRMKRSCSFFSVMDG